MRSVNTRILRQYAAATAVLNSPEAQVRWSTKVEWQKWQAGTSARAHSGGTYLAVSIVLNCSRPVSLQILGVERVLRSTQIWVADLECEQV